MMKKLLALLLALVLCVGLTACSAPKAADPTPVVTEAPTEEPAATEAPTEEPAEVAYDGSAVTVKFYNTMGTNLKTVLDRYIVKFNEMYPNITIECT